MSYEYVLSAIPDTTSSTRGEINFTVTKARYVAGMSHTGTMFTGYNVSDEKNVGGNDDCDCRDVSLYKE
jgi:hypothetical protein